jgi:hypothetical protein
MKNISIDIKNCINKYFIDNLSNYLHDSSDWHWRKKIFELEIDISIILQTEISNTIEDFFLSPTTL